MGAREAPSALHFSVSRVGARLGSKEEHSEKDTVSFIKKLEPRWGGG